MKDVIEQDIDPIVYLHDNLINSNYAGHSFNFFKKQPEDDDYLGDQQHFSDGFVNFIEAIKQIRFELQTGQVERHDVFDRLQKAEDDNGLPQETYMDTNGINLSRHVGNISEMFGYGAAVRPHYDYSDCYDGGDCSDARSEVDSAHAKNIKVLTQMLDVYAEAVKAYDYDNVVKNVTESLSKTFTELGLPFDLDNNNIVATVENLVTQINEETQPSGHIVDRKLVPGGSN